MASPSKSNTTPPPGSPTSFSRIGKRNLSFARMGKLREPTGIARQKSGSKSSLKDPAKESSLPKLFIHLTKAQPSVEETRAVVSHVAEYPALEEDANLAESNPIASGPHPSPPADVMLIDPTPQPSPGPTPDFSSHPSVTTPEHLSFDDSVSTTTNSIPPKMESPRLIPQDIPTAFESESASIPQSIPPPVTKSIFPFVSEAVPVPHSVPLPVSEPVSIPVYEPARSPIPQSAFLPPPTAKPEEPVFVSSDDPCAEPRLPALELTRADNPFADQFDLEAPVVAAATDEEYINIEEESDAESYIYESPPPRRDVISTSASQSDRQPVASPHDIGERDGASLAETLHLDRDEHIPLLPTLNARRGNGLITSEMAVTQTLRSLGWEEHVLPDSSSYYHHRDSRITTDVDLRNARYLDHVTDYIGGQLPFESMMPPPQGWELWIKSASVQENNVQTILSWVSHDLRIVTDTPPPTISDEGLFIERYSEDDKHDMRYRYWGFIDGHPAHQSIGADARQEAMYALQWSYTDTLLPSDTAPPPFAPQECQELMNMLRSFDNSSTKVMVVQTRIVSRVLLRVAQWRQKYYRPNRPLPKDVDVFKGVPALARKPSSEAIHISQPLNPIHSPAHNIIYATQFDRSAEDGQHNVITQIMPRQTPFMPGCYATTTQTDNFEIIETEYFYGVADSAVPQTSSLSWEKYVLPNNISYYHHRGLHTTTDVDLCNDRYLQHVTKYLETLLPHDAVPQGWELWIASVPSAQLHTQHEWVNHKLRIVTDKLPANFDKNIDARSSEGYKLDMECRYWSFVVGHPAHQNMSTVTRNEAMDALQWFYMDTLLPSGRKAPPLFEPLECQELMNMLRSYDSSPTKSKAVQIRIISGIFFTTETQQSLLK